MLCSEVGYTKYNHIPLVHVGDTLYMLREPTIFMKAVVTSNFSKLRKHTSSY